MNRLELLKSRYNIVQTENLSFSKGNLSVEFYIDYSFIESEYIKPARLFSDSINIIHICYKNDHAFYFQVIRDLWESDQFKMHQKNEEETIDSIENILLLVFLNQEEYRIKAENQWLIAQIKKRHFLCLGAILDTTYDPHKNERVFNPNKRLDKESFKVYEVRHLYASYNKKQDWWNVYKENYFFIKYDNNYVSDNYINKLIPSSLEREFLGSECFGVSETLEIIFREDLTEEFRNKYDRNEHYRYFLNPIALEISDNYKTQIKDIFNQLKENTNHIYQAEQLTWNYRKLSPTMTELVDMLLFFIENGLEFKKKIGSKKEPVHFSYYMHRSYENALSIISNNKLQSHFEERIKKILYEKNKMNE